MIEPTCTTHTKTPVPWCRACRDYWLRCRALIRAQDTPPADLTPEQLAEVAALIEPGLAEDPVIRKFYLGANEDERATLDRATTELYRSFTNTELLDMRRALVLDAENGSPLTVTFCRERMQLIDDVLAERLRR